MKRPSDITPRDWTHLLSYLSELPDDKLARLYEVSENLSETAQLSLLKQAAERVKGKGKKKASAEISTDHSTRQGEEKTEDKIESAPSRRRRKKEPRQGEEKMVDAI